MYKYLLLLVFFIELSLGNYCIDAAPSANYTESLYEGFWYEVAKIQTKGGAFFERNCVCTSIDVTYLDNGNAVANETCRSKTVDGPLTTVYGSLTQTTQPGRWIETIYPGAYNSVNYTVIEIGNDYAVEYDCGSGGLGFVNYCLHYMSRTPTMDSDLLNELVLATSYLNVQNLPLTQTLQDGCW